MSRTHVKQRYSGKAISDTVLFRKYIPGFQQSPVLDLVFAFYLLDKIKTKENSF
jgi:hypothetical protein